MRVNGANFLPKNDGYPAAEGKLLVAAVVSLQCPLSSADDPKYEGVLRKVTGMFTVRSSPSDKMVDAVDIGE